MNTPAPDYGEPWRENITMQALYAGGDMTIVLYDADDMPEPYRSRAIVCVNSLAGIADPEAAIQSLRELISDIELHISASNVELIERIHAAQELFKPQLTNPTRQVITDE